MRKYQQGKILKLIKTLYEAHNELKKQIKHEDYVNLLSECQDFAIKIGEYIERIEGQETQTVKSLEKYCEMIYQATLEERSNGYAKKLVSQLVKIENLIKSELKPNKIEIVLFPYQLSMFDAFESIYYAAKADPCCSVYVVPIPWYDKQTDGMFGNMHYDGNQYPESIPVMHWQEYDVETRHPDVIFIHNPYDDINCVTSVHPSYYSEKLKLYTDMLCYVPYFVVTDDVPEHFITLPACIYADKVFLQSEKIQRTYIQVFEEKYGKNVLDLRNKFIALGSPKYDKVNKSKFEDFSLPSGWLEMITNKEGKKKNIVLYNTSINALLDSGELHLNKIRSVLELFSTQEDIILWWRPHPLSEETYFSMRPQLLEEYRQLVARFKSSGIGIFDDTSNLHRAISLSDVYYGDGSSLVSMYQMAQKPIIIQNCEKSFSTLAFENFYDDGDHYWVTLYYFNALIKINKQTKNYIYIGSFPNEKLDKHRLYTSTVEINKKFYFTPCSANTIAIYDKALNQFTQIELENSWKNTKIKFNENLKFYSSVTYKKWLFFIPFSFPAIVRYDTISGSLDYYTDWVESMRNQITEDFNYFFKGAVTVNNKIYTPSVSTNIVLEFDMDTCISRLYNVGESEYGYSDICYDGNDLWLCPRNDMSVVKWNPKKNQFYTFLKKTSDKSIKHFNYVNIASLGDSIWLFPYYANRGIKVNKFNEELIFTDLPYISKTKKRSVKRKNIDSNYHNKYLFVKSAENVIYAFEGSTNTFITYDYKSGEYSESRFEDINYPLDFLDMLRLRNISNILDKKETSCLYETPLLTLNYYMDIIEKGKLQNLWVKKTEEDFLNPIKNELINTAGAAIYKYCKDNTV